MPDTSSSRPRKRETDKESVLPHFVERMFGVAEVFTSRFMDILSSSTEELISRAAQRFFVLLLLGVGIVFMLSGSADILNQMLRYPGIGEVAVGAMLLFVTSTMLLVQRNK